VSAVERSDRFFDALRGHLLPGDWPAAPSDGLRPAGVLVPLRARGNGVTVVLARRTEQVPHHKGQVCFPGGSRDPGDRDLLVTALREAEEELGIRTEEVELLGSMDPVETVTGFSIRPFVGRIPPTAAFRLAEFEVAEVFEPPLAVFGEFHRYRWAEADFRGRGSRVYFFDYGPYTIWGATATILHDLAVRIYGTADGNGSLPSVE
jgi:8-oxo-dGTP pyrophosphatase MutT (NUDIX family)